MFTFLLLGPQPHVHSSPVWIPHEVPNFLTFLKIIIFSFLNKGKFIPLRNKCQLVILSRWTLQPLLWRIRMNRQNPIDYIIYKTLQNVPAKGQWEGLLDSVRCVEYTCTSDESARMGWNVSVPCVCSPPGSKPRRLPALEVTRIVLGPPCSQPKGTNMLFKIQEEECRTPACFRN